MSLIDSRRRRRPLSTSSFAAATPPVSAAVSKSAPPLPSPVAVTDKDEDFSLDENEVEDEELSTAEHQEVEESSPEVLLARMPLAFTRTGLFGIRTHQQMQMIKRHLPSCPLLGKHFEVHYQGPELNQNHALIWQAVLQLAREQGAFNGYDEKEARTNPQVLLGKVQFSVFQVLRMLGKQPSALAYEWFRSHLSDLASAIISLRNSRIGVQYMGGLLPFFSLVERGVTTENKRPRKLVQIVLNLCFASILQNDYAQIDLNQKVRFNESQLSMWLYDFLEGLGTLRNTTFSIRDIRTMCGDLAHYGDNAAARKRFLARIKSALDRLVESEHSPLTAYVFSGRGTELKVKFTLSRPGKVVMMAPPKQPRPLNAREMAIKQAQEARGKVAL